MPILFPGRLPPGALVHGHTTAPAIIPPTDRPAPIWLTVDPACCEFSEANPGRITGWQARGDQNATALAVAANESGTHFVPSPPHLQFETGVNGGMFLPDTIPDADCVTVGMICRLDPGEDARTLLSLQSRGDDNYLFLSGDDGNLRLTQKTGEEELMLPLPEPAAKAVLLLFAVASGRMFMAVNAAQPVSATTVNNPVGRADLFVGCRNARSGLQNKLGRFTLTDVMIWPGKNLFDSPDNPALAAAEVLWKARSADEL